MFKTTSHLDENGKRIPLDDLAGFARVDVDGTIKYGVKDNLELRLGGRYRSNNVVRVGSREAISSAGMERFTVGLKWDFCSKGRLRCAADFAYGQTLYSNKEYNSFGAVPRDELVLGDDGSETEVGVHLAYLRNNVNALSVYAGLRMPPNKLSKEIPYSASTLWKNKKWGLEVGVDGVQSLEEESLDNTSNRPVEATSGTLLYNSINRSWMNAFASVYYSLTTQWRLGTKASNVLGGTYTDGGYEVGVSLMWSSKGVSEKDKKIKKFKEYIVTADITKVSSKGLFVRIDAGLSSDIEKGMKFDIYKKDFSGNNLLVATGVAYEVGSNNSVIKIVKRYRGVKVKKGFVAMGY